MNRDHELVALREKHTDARLPFLVCIHSDGSTFCHFVLQNADPYFSPDVPVGPGAGSGALCFTKKAYGRSQKINGRRQKMVYMF